MAPEQAPPPGDEAPAPEGGEGGSGAAELVKGIMQGLKTMQELVMKTQGLPPEVQDKMQAVIDGFMDLVDTLSGGGGQPAPNGPAQPAEAGGNPNARPVGPQG